MHLLDALRVVESIGRVHDALTAKVHLKARARNGVQRIKEAEVSRAVRHERANANRTEREQLPEEVGMDLDQRRVPGDDITAPRHTRDHQGTRGSGSPNGQAQALAEHTHIHTHTHTQPLHEHTLPQNFQSLFLLP